MGSKQEIRERVYGVTVCQVSYPRPQGIYWDLLPQEKIDAIPALKTIA
jgi:hypothetical protein